MEITITTEILRKMLARSYRRGVVESTRIISGRAEDYAKEFADKIKFKSINEINKILNNEEENS